MRVYAISLVSLDSPHLSDSPGRTSHHRTVGPDPTEEPGSSGPSSTQVIIVQKPEVSRLPVTFSRLVRRLGVPRAERMLEGKEAILISLGTVA
jgi:hypothetical protein